MKLRKLIDNTDADVAPLLLFVLTILVAGALYSLFFLEIGYPAFNHLIPDSDAKTFVLMCMYSLPLFVIIVGLFSLFKSALKESFVGGIR